MRVIGLGSAAAGGGESWRDYLDPDEELLWQGAPAGGLRLRATDVLISLFGCIFLGFALFWTRMAAALGAETGFDLMALLGLPFIAVGLHLVAGRILWDAYERRHTRYALTDRRAIVARSALGRSLKSYPIDATTRIDLRPGPEATIWFADEARRGRRGRRYTVKRGFEYIADGDAVYRLMRRIQRGAAGERAG